MNEMLERFKLEIVNNHGDRYIRCDPAPDGSWVMFRDVDALQKRCEEAERTALQAAECHARETRRADALQKRVAELEAQNDTLRHATNKLRAMFTELNARHEPLQRAFITAVELLNDAALEGKKDE